MEGGHHGPNGLSAAQRVAMEHNRESDHAPNHHLNMAGKTALATPLRSKNASLSTVLFTASGWSSLSGAPAALHAMEGLGHVAEASSLNFMEEMNVWEI